MFEPTGEGVALACWLNRHVFALRRGAFLVPDGPVAEEVRLAARAGDLIVFSNDAHRVDRRNRGQVQRVARWARMATLRAVHFGRDEHGRTWVVVLRPGERTDLLVQRTQLVRQANAVLWHGWSGEKRDAPLEAFATDLLPESILAGKLGGSAREVVRTLGPRRRSAAIHRRAA